MVVEKNLNALHPYEHPPGQGGEMVVSLLEVQFVRRATRFISKLLPWITNKKDLLEVSFGRCFHWFLSTIYLSIHSTVRPLSAVLDSNLATPYTKPPTHSIETCNISHL